MATTSPSDPDLRELERVAAGDGRALERLVERHQARLLRLAERLLGDREAARDAVQEVFIKVFRKAGTFRPEGKVSTWLYRITTNHCLNRLRRRRLVRFLSLTGGEDEAQEEWQSADPAPGPGERMLAQERWRILRRAIESLPPNQRAVVVLTRMEGLSYKETAEALGITVGAVESRLFRAMRRLEGEMEDA